MLTLTTALEQLQAGDFQVRWDVAKTLPSFGESAVNPLVELLQNPNTDAELQWVIAKTLGEFSQSAATAALGTLLHTTEDEDLLQIAAQTLAQKGSSAIPALAASLAEGDMALPAVQALAQIRDPEVIPPLLQGSQVNAVNVRAVALEALSLWHDPRVPPLLLAGLRDPNPEIRQVALTGLGYRSDLLESHDLVHQIAPLLWDINSGVCNRAILALGNLATSTATQTLAMALQPTLPVAHRMTIIQTFGRIGTIEAVVALQEAWQWVNHDGSRGAIEFVGDAQAIAEALARVEEASARVVASQVLVEMLTPKTGPSLPGRVRCAIANSLGHLHQADAMPALIQLLADPDIAVRLHAIAALKHLNAEQAQVQLHALAQDTTLAPQLADGIRTALQEW